MTLDFDARLSAFEQLGCWLDQFLKDAEKGTLSDEFDLDFQRIIERQSRENGWFTEYNIYCALAAMRDNLTACSLSKLRFVFGNRVAKSQQERRVAVAAAGIFPISSFYDFMMVLLTGNVLLMRLHSDDKLLLPMVAQKLMAIEPEFEDAIHFVEQLSGFDRIIVVEENGPSAAMRQYLSNYPVFVHPRQRAVAILTGNEPLANLRALSNDICRYFGNSFRSVSKLFLPRKYNFTQLLQAIQEQTEQLNGYNAYLNNLEYQKGIALLNSVPFYDAGPMILVENEQLFAPKSVLHFQYYDKIEEAFADCELYREEISCVMAMPGISSHFLPFGDAYLHDSQNNVVVSDIVEFLI